MSDLNNQPIVGTGLDAQAVIPDSSETTDVNKTIDEFANAQEVTSEDESNETVETDETAEKLRAERAEAITQAIAQEKAAKQAKQELEYYKSSLKVAKDPDALEEIHNVNPELANRISQELYDEAYNQSSKETGNITEAKMFEMFQKFQEKQTQSNAESSIDKSLETFFIDNNILPGSTMFRDINQEFNGYTVKDGKQASTILNAIYASKTTEEKMVNNNAPAMNSRSIMSKKTGKSRLSQSALELAKMAGISDEDMKKYSK